MKLANSTDWTDCFLRRMVSWIAKELDYPIRKIRGVQVRNRTNTAYSGHAYGSRRIVASVGPESCFPTQPDTRPGCEGLVLADRAEGLIVIVAHELAHLSQYLDGRYKNRELDARWHSVHVLNRFRAERDKLISEWSVPPTPRATVPLMSPQQKRAEKATKMLAQWQRKAKLAATKIKTYRRKVAYYERAATQAASKSPNN